MTRDGANVSSKKWIVFKLYSYLTVGYINQGLAKLGKLLTPDVQKFPSIWLLGLQSVEHLHWSFRVKIKLKMYVQSTCPHVTVHAQGIYRKHLYTAVDVKLCCSLLKRIPRFQNLDCFAICLRYSFPNWSFQQLLFTRTKPTTRIPLEDDERQSMWTWKRQSKWKQAMCEHSNPFLVFNVPPIGLINLLKIFFTLTLFVNSVGRCRPWFSCYFISYEVFMYKLTYMYFLLTHSGLTSPSLALVGMPNSNLCIECEYSFFTDSSVRHCYSHGFLLD